MAGGQLGSRGTGELNVTVLAVGKTSGPEAELTARYLERAQKAGRQMGISRVSMREIPDQAGPRRADLEAAMLLSRRGGGVLIALDERGAGWSSADFARYLRQWADLSADCSFAVGGADGHGEELRRAADVTVSLGAITLPHLLARAVLCEQIYRAVTLCIGHPYHRA